MNKLMLGYYYSRGFSFLMLMDDFGTLIRVSDESHASLNHYLFN